MTPKLFLCTALASTLLLSGCASVPFASEHESLQAKSFPVPDENKAGLYIYRDSFLGKELKKDVYLDGKCLGRRRIKRFSILRSPVANLIQFLPNLNSRLTISPSLRRREKLFCKAIH